MLRLHVNPFDYTILGIYVALVVTIGVIARRAVASLLVVGARGRAAFPGMLLGSVAEYCVRNGPCPVVVVRTPVSQAPGEGKG